MRDRARRAVPTVWIVPHTHWDREWYHTAARFQVRLARLIDGVLRRIGTASLPAFLLDGQAVVLDDYTELRPEAAAGLRKALSSGRLSAGPWYVLPDELLVSAEALVRNLQTGASTLRRFDASTSSAGYSPDAFGHSAALPSILSGFGIGNAIVWRGFGGARGQDGDLHRWRGSDGAEVLMIHLPRPGYEYGANLPADPKAAAARWRELRALLEPRARSPHWLVLNGADHHAPQPDLAAAVRALRRAARGARVKVGTLQEYTRAVEKSVSPDDLPLAQGELRGGRGHTWALQDTPGTRLYLKQLNAECQRLLERVAEPLAALAGPRGSSLRDELRAAWRVLLENHAHDSICGTSHDAVHREMVVRFARCRTMALEAAARALDLVTGRDADKARQAGRKAWRPHLVVFNTVPRPGSRLVEANVALFRRDVPVGPGSAKRPALKPVAPGLLLLRDARGRAVPYQLLETSIGTDLMESPGHYPDADEVEWRRILFEADLGALAVNAYATMDGGRRTTDDARSRAAHHAPRTTVTGTSLANEFLQADVAADGSVMITDVATREHYEGIGVIEDQHDEGDSYTSAPRGRPVTRPDEVGVRIVHAGPLRAQLEVVRRYHAAALDITMQLVLEAGSRTLGCWLEGVNLQEDHRIRVAFPSGLRNARVLADAHFGGIERGPTFPAPRPTPQQESAAATAPMQRWISVAGQDRGLCVISDGLPQYEVRADGTVLITVLRATGQLSKAGLAERPGNAGWPTPTPEGQCIGPFNARLAVAVTSAGEQRTPDAYDRLADEFLVPPVAVMQRACVETPRSVSGPALEGAGLVFSAMKPAESGRGVVLRCFNARDEAVSGAWHLPAAPRRAEVMRLDEAHVQRLRTSRELPVNAGARGTVTLGVE